MESNILEVRFAAWYSNEEEAILRIIVPRYHNLEKVTNSILKLSESNPGYITYVYWESTSRATVRVNIDKSGYTDAHVIANGLKDRILDFMKESFYESYALAGVYVEHHMQYGVRDIFRVHISDSCPEFDEIKAAISQLPGTSFEFRMVSWPRIDCANIVVLTGGAVASYEVGTDDDTFGDWINQILLQIRKTEQNLAEKREFSKKSPTP